MEDLQILVPSGQPQSILVIEGYRNCEAASNCCVREWPQTDGMGKHVFITVGTTKFDALIEAIDHREVLAGLSSKGFSSITAQIGHGEHLPTFDVGQVGMRCEWYRFKPTLHEDMARADMVISHAGAGSVMEALGMGKALVVVVNTALMDNHQVELAEALAERGYLRATTPEVLARTLAEFDDSPSARTPYPQPQPQAFAALVDEEMCSKRRCR